MLPFVRPQQLFSHSRVALTKFRENDNECFQVFDLRSASGAWFLLKDVHQYCEQAERHGVAHGHECAYGALPTEAFSAEP